jgi:hypothetical protein
MKGKVNCTCGWSWNKSDSSKKDMYICHECGRDNSNNMKNGGWLDSYEDGGTMQEHQENYNDSQASAPEGMVGDGFSNVGRNYSPAWGGQFEDGGEIPNAQSGRATRADSLAVYNNSRKVEQFYNKKGYKYNTRLEPFRLEPKDTHKENDIAYNNFSHVDEQLGGNWYGNATMTKNSYRKNIDENKYQQREIPYKAINIDAPMQLFDRRIIPKTSKIISGGTDVVVFGSYNNIANKPFDLLTEKEKAQRVKLYGIDGVPKSYLNANKKLNPEKKSIKKSSEAPVYNKVQKRYEWEGELNSLPKKQKVVVKQDLPRVEAINLPPMQNQPIGLPNIDLNIPNYAKVPTSFDISSQRYNMEGPSDYYDQSVQGATYEQTLRATQASDAYNRDIEKRYGPQNEYRTEKSKQEAARRLEQLRQDVKATPNYQMGGNIYPVNYVPQAAMGASMPGSVGFTYARTKGIPSEGPYAKKTLPSAQNGGWLDGYDEAQEGERVLPNNNRALQILTNIQKRKQKGEPSPQFSNVKIKDERGEAVKKVDNTRTASKPKFTDINKTNVRNKTEDELAEQKRINDEAIIADRKARMADAMKAQDEDIIGNPNWKEVLARETQSTGDKFRLFPNDPDSFIDDWLNPGVMIGDMASSLGAAPYDMEQQESMMPLITAIGVPLLTGGLEGIGAKTNRQFVNNLFNPVNMVPGYKSAEKYVGNKLKNIPTSITPELRQGLQTNGISDLYKINPWATKIDDAATKIVGEGKNSFIYDPAKPMYHRTYKATPNFLTGYKQIKKPNQLDFSPIINPRTEEFKNKALQNFKTLTGGKGDDIDLEQFVDYFKSEQGRQNLKWEYQNFLSNINREKYYDTPEWKNVWDDSRDQAEDIFGKIEETLQQKASPLGKRLGSGAEGSVYELADDPDKVIKIGTTFKTNNADDLVKSFEGITDDNIARVLRAHQDNRHLIEIMPNLNANAKFSNFTKEQVLDKLEKDAKVLMDKGFQLDVDNINGNFRYNPDKNKVDIYDISKPAAGQTSQNPEAVLRILRNHFNSTYRIPGTHPSHNPNMPTPEFEQGGIIKDDRGQWGEHKGEPTRINQSKPGSYIDMGPDPLTGEPLTEPLLGISDKGEKKIMYPGEKHKYKKGTKYVDEFPIAKNGLRQEQKGLQNLEDLTNFTNYNKPSNWLNKYN